MVLFCVVILLGNLGMAHCGFTGIYHLQGIRSFPAVEDLQTHCNKIVLAETYHIVKRNEQDIEFRPGYDSYSISGALGSQDSPTLTSSTFVGHFTGYDTFSGNFHGMLLSNCSGQFLNSMTLLHCPVPKEESFSGRCIITLECKRGPCVERGGAAAKDKAPFEVAAVDFFIWLWKRLFLALIVTTTPFAALGLSFFTVNFALQRSRAKKGQAKMNLLDWLTTDIAKDSNSEMQPKSPYRRTRSADYLSMDTGAEYLDAPLLEDHSSGAGAHKRNRSFGLGRSREFAFPKTGSVQHISSDQNLHRRDVSHGSSSGDLKKIVSVPALSEYV